MASGAMDKSPDAFRTISEVAEDIDLPQHVLRFWETRFAQIKPLKRGGGRRYYRPEDIDLLKGIRHLLYGEGYTIRGVQKILKEEGPRFVQAIGRGEEKAPARTSAPDAFEEESEDWSEKRFPEPSLDGNKASTLSPEALQSLQTALDELLECERVLSSLRAPAEGSGTE